MNILLRFLLAYIIITASILALYMNITKEYKKKVALTQSQLNGLEYLKGIYNLSLSTALYTGALDVEDDRIKLLNARKKMLDDINTIYKLGQKYPQFQTETLYAKLQYIEKSKFTTADFYEFLDYLNHENYRVGDVSKLLFEIDRKIYFLGTLTTHYMPEYLISLLTVNNIVNEFTARGRLSDFKKGLYTEQNKLVDLSVEEISEIIEILQSYEDTRELSPLINKISTEVKHLSEDMASLAASSQLSHTIHEHKHSYDNLLDLSYQLNNKYMDILESNLHKREETFQERVLFSTLILSFILFFISAVTFYWYRGVLSNIKKDLEIKNINEILDKHVIFSKTDAEGRITYISTALESLSGYTRDELIGRTHAIFRHKDTKDSLFNDMWKTITSKKTWTGVLKNKKRDGNYYWAKVSIRPELDEHGEITGYSAYREDITNQKALEAEKTKTQEALEVKSMFLSNMSHEIRTPLNGIIGLTYMALKTDLDEQQKELLSKIKSASNILLGVINDILDISKIESGKMTVERAPFDLKEAVENIEGMLASKIAEQGITFDVDYTDMSNFDYLGDSLRISQILTNLLTNAIKFTSSGGVHLRIKETDDKLIQFEVKDTGIGLKEEDIKKLFNEFAQADMSTSRKYGGTGLGLAITKNLVEMMGGKIWIESEYGVGSTFTFVLPLEVASDIDKSGKEDIEDIDTLIEKLNTIEDAHILVAEDHAMNQMVIRMALEETKLEIDFALDGKIAVEMFKQKPYDIVLMDIQMPNMNGYEAAQAIRSVDSKTPIIALSANVMQEDIQKSLDSGMDEHLAKPIEFDKLYRTLFKYLSRKK